VKFSEICYVLASRKKKPTKNCSSISAFFSLFLPKNSQNRQKMKKIAKIQTV